MIKIVKNRLQEEDKGVLGKSYGGMNWQDKIKENEKKLLQQYQINFDKACRDNWTPSMNYWLMKMRELENEINER